MSIVQKNHWFADIECPVCGEPVFDDVIKFTKTDYKGNTYYFCDAGCKKEFESEPEIYIYTRGFFYGRMPRFLFTWEEIPGSLQHEDWLITFLKGMFDVDWVTNAKIEKIDEDKTIRLSWVNNFLYLKLNDNKTKVSLKIDDGRTYKFIAKVGECIVARDLYMGKHDIYVDKKPWWKFW